MRNNVYYPKLPVYGMQSWQYIERCRIRKRFSLEQILEKNLETTGRTSILKEICHRELSDCIEKRKKKRFHRELSECIEKRKEKRHATRFELGKVGLRQRYPQDVINEIYTFTRFF